MKYHSPTKSQRKQDMYKQSASQLTYNDDKVFCVSVTLWDGVCVPECVCQSCVWQNIKMNEILLLFSNKRFAQFAIYFCIFTFYFIGVVVVVVAVFFVSSFFFLFVMKCRGVVMYVYVVTYIYILIFVCMYVCNESSFPHFH